MNAPARSLRELMPVTAAFIDEMREVFGAEGINQSIKGGMAGVPTFHAAENGQQVGTKLDLAGRHVVNGRDLMIDPPPKVKNEDRNHRR